MRRGTAPYFQGGRVRTEGTVCGVWCVEGGARIVEGKATVARVGGDGYGLDHLKGAGNKATSVVVDGGSGRTVPTRRTNGANKESERR